MWRGEVLPNPTGSGFYATVETTNSDMTEDEARQVMGRALNKLNAPDAPAPVPANLGEGTGTGKVKWYNPDKGFGFIVPDDGGRDVFVHASVVRDAGLVELVPDQAVTFAVTQGPKGPQAASISG